MGEIRIIAGKWRGRKISVGDFEGLRPTPDRIRETLFNWLQSHISEARCLDLFAGSGVLGLEALSRGAKSVTFIEKLPPASMALKKIVTTLAANTTCEIIQTDAIVWLQQQKNISSPSMDIIFLDPPFSSGLLLQALKALTHHPLVGAKTLIYIESAKSLTAEELPPNWQILKQKQAGEVAYHLVQGARE